MCRGLGQRWIVKALMNVPEISQLRSPSDGQDPALQVQSILANLADTGWLEKESDAEGSADKKCPDHDSNQRQDVYDFDSECPPGTSTFAMHA